MNRKKKSAKRPSKYQKPLKIDMPFDEFMARVAKVKKVKKRLV